MHSLKSLIYSIRQLGCPKEEKMVKIRHKQLFFLRTPALYKYPSNSLQPLMRSSTRLSNIQVFASIRLNSALDW